MKNLDQIIDENKSVFTPAQKEYLAGAELMQKKEFLKTLCDQFKEFGLESGADHCGHDEDHLEYLKQCVEVFIDLKNEGME